MWLFLICHNPLASGHLSCHQHFHETVGDDAAHLKVQVCQPSPTSCAGQMHLLLSPRKAHFLWSQSVVMMNGP